jgi:hypothetical protein
VYTKTHPNPSDFQTYMALTSYNIFLYKRQSTSFVNDKSVGAMFSATGSAVNKTTTLISRDLAIIQCNIL